MFVTKHFEGKRLICGPVYRPRNDNLELRGFFDSFNLVLRELDKTKSKCFLMGDLNFDLLDLSDKKTEQFTDIMFNENFYPLINKPPRITDSSSSAIDYTWTNVSNISIKSGIIAHCVADHLLVIQVSNLGKITKEMLTNDLTKEMLKRVEALKNAKGSQTKYYRGVELLNFKCFFILIWSCYTCK